MKVLALDTSAMVAAAAVMDEEKLLGEFLINHKRTHSQKLMPMISELLNSIELKPADIDIFAVSKGPGSFTGLRIGVTTIKAMAYALNRPVVSVPTLDALSYNMFPLDGYLSCPIMDARNDQVYTAVYKMSGMRQERMTDYMGVHVSELVALLGGMNQKVVFAGDAVPLHREYLSRELGSSCLFAPGFLLGQRASSVAQLALLNAKDGLLESSFDTVPFYLRKSQAEREFEKKAEACTYNNTNL